MNKLFLPLLLILLLFACSGSNDEISEMQKPLESSGDDKKWEPKRCPSQS